MATALLSKEEAKKYMNDFTNTAPIETVDYKQEAIVKKNSSIMRAADDLILDRLENQDSSLRISDILAAKAEAFKQNQLLTNKSTENISVIGSILTQIQSKST